MRVSARWEVVARSALSWERIVYAWAWDSEEAQYYLGLKGKFKSDR
jgi:hypothetical protein